MNHQAAKSLLYILLGVSGLIIALAVGYYFLITLPSIEQDKIDYQRQYDQQQQEKEEAKKDQEILETSQIQQEKEEAKQNETYRQECIVMQDETITDFEKFISTCTSYGGTAESCLQSEGGQFYADTLQDYLIKCIEDKKSLRY